MIDLVGTTVVISVEPQPDDSAAPFILKPLIDMNAEDLGESMLQDLEVMDAAPELQVTTM